MTIDTRAVDKFLLMIAVMFVILGFPQLAAHPAHEAHSSDLDTLLIKQTLGQSGVWNADEGVYRLNIPRTDVKVKVDGILLPPYMGLTTWVGFQRGDSTMVMGDLVLFPDEVNPVMSVLLDGGMTVTALHNHFFYAEPMVLFMHIGGDGNLDVFVKTVKAVFDEIKAIRAENPTPAGSFGYSGDISSSNITAAPIEQILGLKGAANNGMLKFVVGRSVKMSCGCTAGKDMGISTWAGFMGSDSHALIDGDFATADAELQPVLKSLRHSGINVVAIHNHMEGENPHLTFLHYWGIGAAAQLAQGLKSALDAQSAEARAAR